MEPIYFCFFVSKSVEVCIVDTYLKFCMNKLRFCSRIKIPKVRFLISSIELSNFSPILVRTFAGLVTQLFFSKPFSISKSFGLRNSREHIQYWETLHSFTLKYFWFYCPAFIVSKFISLGIKGTHFRYLRFIIFDIFNFLGSDFYQKFYLNYFEFPGIFILDFFNEFINFKYQTSYKYVYKNYQLQICRAFRVSLTFFKILRLVLFLFI